MRDETLVKLVRIGILLGILGGFVVGGMYLYQFMYAPRMKNQPHIRTFEASMPPLPAGTVPVFQEPVPPDIGRDNPLEITAETVARGRVYYAYYCLACHGEHWDGNGPVGQSYMPVPTDLTSPGVQNYSDGSLLRAMLTGIGHEPLLQRVVPPEHRWYLVAFVRSLPGEPGEEFGKGPAHQPVRNHEAPVETPEEIGRGSFSCRSRIIR